MNRIVVQWVPNGINWVRVMTEEGEVLASSSCRYDKPKDQQQIIENFKRSKWFKLV